MKVSQYIANQFPEFYKEEGENFIAFVEAYYQWMEEDGNLLDRSSKLLDLRDIDTTEEELLIHFKNKYLESIQLYPETNTRLLVKNALNLYRAKGSERSIELFFKLVFAQDCRVHYPGDDIFKLSDNTWFVPRFLEMPLYSDALQMVGKQITGSQSKATAFAEKMIRRRNTNGDWASLLYITDIVGTFQENEEVRAKGIITSIPAVIRGSITSVDIEYGGEGFEKGDRVFICNSSADSCEAIVTSVKDGGIESLKLVTSGFGFRGTDVAISKKDTINAAIGTINLAGVGFDEGYFRNYKGFLSNNKALFDGNYYQEYSYEVFSPLSFDKYKKSLNDVLHVSGTKMFGSVDLESSMDWQINFSSIVEELG